MTRRTRLLRARQGARSLLVAALVVCSAVSAAVRAAESEPNNEAALTFEVLDGGAVARVELAGALTDAERDRLNDAADAAVEDEADGANAAEGDDPALPRATLTVLPETDEPFALPMRWNPLHGVFEAEFPNPAKGRLWLSAVVVHADGRTESIPPTGQLELPVPD